MAKKRKKKTNWNLILPILVFVGIAGIFLILYFQMGTEMDRSMKEEGYTTNSKSDPFYKNVVTNNTLDDYYNDLSNQTSSAYEEYYLSKDSLVFIEMKLNYEKGVVTSLNISSDLLTKQMTYNFELSYESSYLLIEGSNMEPTCHVISEKNISENSKNYYCDYLENELETFLERRNQVESNEQVQTLLQEKMEKYNES